MVSVSRTNTAGLEDDPDNGLDSESAVENGASAGTRFVQGQQLGGHCATQLLRGMPGALDAAHEGSAQARRGELTPLDAI